MKFQFKLRNGKNGYTIISELRMANNIRIRLATKCVVPNHSVKYWDNNKELLKYPNDVQNSIGINNDLNRIRAEVYAHFGSLKNNSTLDKDQLSEQLHLIINPTKSTEPKLEDNKRFNFVLKYFDWYIDFYSENISPNTGSVLSKGTLRTYRNSARYLKDYLNDREFKKFTFDNINKEFYYDYVQYGQELDYSKNYIGSMIQKLKTIIQSAYDDDVHSNGEFKKRYFKKFSEEVNHPYLNLKEIQALNDLEVEDGLLDAIRDIFVILCFTGLRIGDFMRFLKNPKIESFNGKKHIYVIQHKTKKPVFIPLKKEILHILQKRNGNYPPYIHQNIINRDIKHLLRKCGVTELFEIEKTIGGNSVAVIKPKYQLISCHSARRSFCTNAYNCGVPLQDIMAFSGHGSEKMVLLYIKASAKERAKRASDHAFFS